MEPVDKLSAAIARIDATLNKVSPKSIRADAEFDESKHPRSEDGKFGSGGGGGSASKPSAKARTAASKPAASLVASHARVNDLLARLQKAAAREANAGNVTYANVGSMNEVARILETAAGGGSASKPGASSTPAAASKPAASLVASHARVNDLLKRLQKAAAGEANAGNITYANVGSMNEIARILETAAAFLNAT